jgi:MazG family protein
LAFLQKIVAHLRHPTSGCPWDIAQTHASLRPYLLEEAYEAVEALTQLYVHPNDAQAQLAVKDELGDVLLQVALHAQLASEQGQFTLDDIAQHLADKLVRRHPHVFGTGGSLTSPEAVTAQWQQLKQAEKPTSTLTVPSALGELKANQPALSQASVASKRAIKQGFTWPTIASLWVCVMSEFDELKAEMDAPAPSPQALEDELGDCLFATVSLANQLGIDPEVALHRATQKFIRRFHAMESLTKKPLPQLSFEEWDTLWRQAKQATESAA